MKRTSYSLAIGRLDDVKEFARRINFSIYRKAKKLEDALSVIESYKAGSRSTEWNRLYSKKNGEWVRRSLSPRVIKEYK